MTAKPTSDTPAGWYPDPSRRSGERYWDGSRWGDRRGNGEVVVTNRAASTAQAGWYPHPLMAGTQRYWDGANWTDHVAPMKKGADPKLLRNIAWAVAFAFLVPVLLITFNEPTVAGHSCGTWFNSNYSSTDVLLKEADITLGKDASYGSVEELDLVAAACNDKLASQRTLALVLLGLGGGFRIAVPLIVRAIRD